MNKLLDPSSLKLPLSGRGDRSMSVELLRDSASTHSQQRGGASKAKGIDR
ncbi:choline/carnitine O-acyltransferase [Candidatus Regiella insecticola]|nr:choline/carnitine O-acyltransferase [Candidatus Regiella insecticola]